MILIFFIFLGCGQKFGNLEKPITGHERYYSASESPVVVHSITDFIITDEKFDEMPDLNVDINLTEPITFDILFQLLISQDVNVLADFESDQKISIPKYKGSVKDFLKNIQQSFGLFFLYRNGCLIVKQKTTVFLKVLMPELKDKLINILLTFGIDKAFHDSLSSRIVFETDYYTYQKVKDYFYNNPYLTFCVFDIMVLESQNKKENESGLDWHSITALLGDLGTNPFQINVNGDANSGFTFGVESDYLSIQSVFKSLESVADFKVVQNARLSTLNGTTGTLDVSEKIPYVSSIDLGSLNDSSDTVVQGYEFDTATSGLIIELTPTILENLISISFESKIQSLIEFLEVGSSLQTVQQPVLAIRNIKNQIVTSPGKTILIGGLQYKKGGSTYKSIQLVDSGLSQYESKIFSITVLLRCELVKYVFLEGGV